VNLIVFYSNKNKSSIKLNVIDIKYLVVKEKIQKNKDIYGTYKKYSMLANSLTNDCHLRYLHEHMLLIWCYFSCCLDLVKVLLMFYV